VLASKDGTKKKRQAVRKQESRRKLRMPTLWDKWRDGKFYCLQESESMREKSVAENSSAGGKATCSCFHTGLLSTGARNTGEKLC